MYYIIYLKFSFPPTHIPVARGMGLARVEISYLYPYPCKPAAKPAQVCRPVPITTKAVAYINHPTSHPLPSSDVTDLERFPLCHVSCTVCHMDWQPGTDYHNGKVNLGLPCCI